LSVLELEVAITAFRAAALMGWLLGLGFDRGLRVGWVEGFGRVA
jgi:hypothetical protein